MTFLTIANDTTSYVRRRTTRLVNDGGVKTRAAKLIKSILQKRVRFTDEHSQQRYYSVTRTRCFHFASLINFSVVSSARVLTTNRFCIGTIIITNTNNNTNNNIIRKRSIEKNKNRRRAPALVSRAFASLKRMAHKRQDTTA